MPEVVVYMLEGRTLEQRRGLVKDITAAVVERRRAAGGSIGGPRTDAEGFERQRRRVIQRDAATLADPGKRLCGLRNVSRICRRAAFEILVSAAHNILAAMRDRADNCRPAESALEASLPGRTSGLKVRT
jgi:hypothetical protein